MGRKDNAELLVLGVLVIGGAYMATRRSSSSGVASGYTKPQLEQIVRAAFARHGVPESWGCATAEGESNWNPNAQNPDSTARGLMQILKSTAAGIGVSYDSLFNPDVSADAAARLYVQLGTYYKWDPRKTLGAYYSGPGNMDLYLSRPGFPPPDGPKGSDAHEYYMRWWYGMHGYTVIAPARLELAEKYGWQWL